MLFRNGPYIPLTSYRFLQTKPLPVTPLRFGLSPPFGRGDACLTQAGVARHAWQTKKALENSPRLFYRFPSKSIKHCHL